MKFKIDCFLKVALEGVEIEANSEQEALEKLYSMDAKELINYNDYDYTDFSDETVKLEEATYNLEVSDVVFSSYDVDEAPDVAGKKFHITIDSNDNRLQSDIADELEFKLGFRPVDFSYKVLKVY